MTKESQHLRRRSFLGLAAAGGLSMAGLSACSGPAVSGKSGSGSGTAASTPAQDYSGVKPAANIDFWSVHPGQSIQTETALVKAYNASQSDTTVRLVTAGSDYPTVLQKFTTAHAASKGLPALLTLGASWWFPLYLTRSLAPLDSLAKAVELDDSDYHKAFWDGGLVNNQQYLIPYARSSVVFYYNSVYWKAAGLPDRGPTTWAELKEWAPKILAKTSTKTAYLYEQPSNGGQLSYGFQNHVWGWGGQYSKDFTFTLTSDETMAAIKAARAAILQDKWASVAEKNAATDFAAGAAGCILTSSAGLGAMLKSTKSSTKVIPKTAFVPGGPKVKNPVAAVAGSSLAVPSGIPPEQQVAAMRFIKWLTNAKNTVTFCQATGYIPVRKSADTSVMVKNVPQSKTAIDQLPQSRPQGYARTRIPSGAKYLDFDLLKPALTSQSADVESLADQTDKKLESVYNSQVKPHL